MHVISPELALIDPDLAAHARALLPEPGQFRPASHPAPAVSLLRPAQRRAPSPHGSQQLTSIGRYRRRRATVVSMACMATIAVGVLAFMQLRAQPESTTAIDARTALRTRAARQVQVARTYTWPLVPGAETYRIEIRRGAQSIYQATTRNPALALPAGLYLIPGRYTWTATPHFANPSRSAPDRPVVEETFQVSAT